MRRTVVHDTQGLPSSTRRNDNGHDRTVLRPAAALSLAGLLTYVSATVLHTGGPANDHPVIFDDYAGSSGWGAVHLVQFLGVALLVAGLVALRGALERLPGLPTLVDHLSRLGAACAGVALALHGALQAVDGVALKQAADAWAAAAPGDRAVRFADAETVRWLEWGARSYHDYALGLALVLLGVALVLASTAPRGLGLLVAISGLVFLVQGWTVGAEGFSALESVAITAGYLVTLTWTTWLVVLAWRRPTAGLDER